MLQLSRLLKQSRTLKALIGMGAVEFEEICETFTRVLEQAALSKPR